MIKLNAVLLLAVPAMETHYWVWALTRLTTRSSSNKIKKKFYFRKTKSEVVIMNRDGNGRDFST